MSDNRGQHIYHLDSVKQQAVHGTSKKPHPVDLLPTQAAINPNNGTKLIYSHVQPHNVQAMQGMELILPQKGLQGDVATSLSLPLADISQPHVIYTQPQLQSVHQLQQTQRQTHTTVQSQSHMDSTVNTHLQLQQPMQANSQMHVQAVGHQQLQVDVKPQISQPHCVPQTAITQPSVLYSFPNMVDTQVSLRQTQQNQSNFGNKTIHQGNLDLGDISPARVDSQLGQSLASDLGAALGLHSGNSSLALTLNQLINPIEADKVFIPDKNGDTQVSTAVGSTTASISIDAVSLMRLQGTLNIPLDDSLLPVMNASKMTTGVELPVSQMDNTSMMTHQESHQLPNLSVSNMHAMAHTSVASPDNRKTNTYTNSFIANNKLLNKMLDSSKPHIPSQVSRAAEIAQLVPSQTMRPGGGQRVLDLGEGPEVAFPAGTREASTIKTSATGTSMCTVTGALQGTTGFGDVLDKTSTPMQLDGLIGMSSNFQSNNNTFILPPTTTQVHYSQPRQFDSMQSMLGSQAAKVDDVNELKLDQQRLWSTSIAAQDTQAVQHFITSVAGGAVGLDKNTKTTLTRSSQDEKKICSILGLPNMTFENSCRTKVASFPKPEMISTSDPMFTSGGVSAGNYSSSECTFGVPKLPASQDGATRVHTSIANTKSLPQSFADLLNRGSSSDGLMESGSSLPLIGLSERGLPHAEDVLLSELHRSDESDLSLPASLTGAAADDLQGNPITLVAEPPLGSGMGGDTAPLQGLPSPPLPSFSLPSITSDFIVGGASGNKSSNQGHLPAILSHLATSADLEHFLDTSNMCIDISNLSESDASLNAAGVAFACSSDRGDVIKKNLHASDLTFTNALKAATTKPEIEQPKLLSESELPNTKPVKMEKEPLQTLPCSTNATKRKASLDLPNITTEPNATAKKSTNKKSNGNAAMKSEGAYVKKRKEIFRKNELLVQQVACFKCRICSCLSQDRGEMVQHMKEKHSQYLSESDESEPETETQQNKRVKVFLPRSETQTVESPPSPKPTAKRKEKTKKPRTNGRKQETSEQTPTGKPKKHIIEEVQDTGIIGVFIKTEPKEANQKKKTEKDVDESAECASEVEPKNQEVDECYTNDSTASENGLEPSTTEPQESSESRTLEDTKAPPALNGRPFDRTSGIKCDVKGCNLSMINENNLKYHKKCHNSNTMQCQECQRKFSTWRDLALHLWRQHLIDMELYKCDKCDYKSYSYTKLMNVHYKIHSDERPSLCDICGKRFKTPKQLRNHKLLHLKVPQIHCETCQRPFTDKRMLNNHIEHVHKKVKPFLCNYCGYSTASKSTLKMHMRQHTGEKPFACEECSYRTADHNSLRRHKMRHSGVRPYRCPYCDYASIQSTTFKVHLKVKHPDLAHLNGIMFTCGVCSFKTIKKDNYLTHVAEHNKADTKKPRPTASATAATTTPPVTTPAAATSTTTTTKTAAPQSVVSPASTTAAPHVVNIDVNSGTFTVENPQECLYLNNMPMLQAAVPGQIIMAGDNVLYALDSSTMSQMRNSEGSVRLTPVVVAVPVDATHDTATSPGLMYVATSQGGQ